MQTNPSSIHIRVGIAGGAGYTGGELLRLLLRHPQVTISFVHSNSNGGKPLHAVHGDLIGETDLLFSAELFKDAAGNIATADVLFLCMGHGEAQKFLQQHPLREMLRVIDLSQDFRLPGSNFFESREFIYGLPECNRAAICNAFNIANPGCFATAIQLGLLPIAATSELPEIHITGITGSTGAGQGFSETSHFSWRQNNIQAYKTLAHQHLKEIGATLSQLQSQAGFELQTPEINFIPWRGDFTRGIFVSAQFNYEGRLEEAYALYEAFYESHPFAVVCKSPIHLKQVVNTNKGIIQLEKVGKKLVVHTAIDNLLKGASGQAVQNMNLMFGLDETTGLQLKAGYF